MSLNVTSNTLEYLGTHTVEDKFPNEVSKIVGLIISASEAIGV